MKHISVLSVLVALSLFAALALLPVSVQASPSTKVDWNDRFAGETTGATGFIIFKDTQQGTTVGIQVLKAKSLQPNHEYEVWVTVSPWPGPPATNTISEQSFGSFWSNAHGNLQVSGIQVSMPTTGTWRVDVFLTHTGPTVPGVGAVGPDLTLLLNRDPLLSCQPALIITST